MKISIIVPIYNVEKYLPRCLDSLTQQTLKDIEIICINDGSPDNSAAIIDDYAKKDPRIIALHQTNQGVSIARNNGIKIAKGEYIGFVDPDDYVDLDFYEKLYNRAIADNLEIVKGTFLIVGFDNKEKQSNLNNQIKEFGKYRFTHEWNGALYKADFLRKNDITFPEKYPQGEDSFFLNKALLQTQHFGLEEDTFYHYIRRSDSLDSQRLNPSKISFTIKTKNLIINNINNSNLYETDPENYHWLFNEHYLSLFATFYRTTDKKSQQFVVNHIIDLFYQNKDISYQEEHFPYKWLLPYIQQKQSEKLRTLLSKFNKTKYLEYPPQSFFQKIFSIQKLSKNRTIVTLLGIRFRIQKKNS